MTAKTYPQIRKASIEKTDFSREREWLLLHGQEYTGQWVVLGDGRLVGHTADSNEVAAIINNAQAEGINIPYVKFIELVDYEQMLYISPYEPV